MSALIILVVLLAGASIAWFFTHKPSTTQSSGGPSGPPARSNNPVAYLSDEEAVVAFNISFVLYLLQSIGASELHTAPLNSDLPRIEVIVDNEAFGAEVENKRLRIWKGGAENEDIIIRTTKVEAVKMLRDRGYVFTSFQNGDSGIELVAGKTTLFGKGYLNLYNKLTGS